ncbi:glycerol-3-phosphate dehydrogenase/oxidase [Chengkuizengella sediminis]|uniref:glycerol-3-phosphate dehydrogenase/oxidase n=1 Tax=Chengkuizengella sediminis TaxID=1885917 RepID=UPI00138A3393|nr:glycerol-3-phosphate dehydrogenase/oxidase [Chengkuizengella sediminis]NDI37159.1 glycerol-3-phosphate dehydrogenase/oxidase [Chengkuizengella sediminis]
MDNLFSSLNRHKKLTEMSQETQDLLIIGGGITGCGIALDAVTRGMKTVLVEMQDFGAGTSSRSTKLVHGGLRYLKQFEIGIVNEVGKERAIVYENGPHVTTPEWMLLPIQKGGTFGKFSTSIGLRIYDYLAKVKKSERRRMLSYQETLEKEPLLKKKGLKGGGYYVEYRTDDARLTIEVIKEAVKYGANAVNYTKVDNLIYDDSGKVTGAQVREIDSGNVYKIYAKKVINATGPWVDNIRTMDKSMNNRKLLLTKGAHLVIDQKVFPLKQSIYFDTSDGRMVFAIPRDGKTYVGTTDTVYSGDTSNPQLTMEDRDYILSAIHNMFPAVKLSEKDFESSWAGVRPLIYEDGKKPSEISRKDEIWQSESGLITIAGGKLTGYRKMAETVVDLVTKHFSDIERRTFLECKTKQLPISGGDVGGAKHLTSFISEKEKESQNYGFTRAQGEHLARLYGSNVDNLFKLAEQYRSHHQYDIDLPLDIFVQLLYGIQYEMVTKPVDFFIRRTGALLFNIDWVRKWKKPVIEYMASIFNWSSEQKSQHIKELEKQLHAAEFPQTS